MMISYEEDKAGRDEGEALCKCRKRRHSSEEVDQPVNDIGNLGELNGQSHSNSLAANNACSKRTKRRSKEWENNLKELTRAVHAVAEALDRGNDAILQGNILLQKMANTKLQMPQLSGEEVWKMLEECECDAEKILDMYCFLMNDVDKLRVAVQCPASMRKQVIMRLFNGGH